MIAKQIRCESRDTLVAMIKRWLTRLADDGNPTAYRLLALYERDPHAIDDFSYELFKDKRELFIRSQAKLFYDAGIAYTFDLRMTEDNDFMGGAGFARVLDPRMTLNINAMANRKRTNARVFTMTDTFSGLLKMNVLVRGVRYCDGLVAQSANYIYPIAGRIGVEKLMSDFVRLTLFTSLGGKTEGGPPTMTDTLTFTTTLSASVNPSVLFAPIGTALQIANANLTTGAARIDVHQVTMSLAINPIGRTELASLRAFIFSPNRDALTARVGPRFTPSLSNLELGSRVIGGGSPSERLAVIANDQAKSREVQFVPQQ